MAFITFYPFLCCSCFLVKQEYYQDTLLESSNHSFNNSIAMPRNMY